MEEIKRPSAEVVAGPNQSEHGGSQEVSSNLNPSVYMTKKEMEMMMKEMRQGIISQHQEMLNRFFIRMDRQRLADVVGIKSLKPETNARAFGFGLEKAGTVPPWLEQVGTKLNQVVTEMNLIVAMLV